jgi:HSP20 family protein
MTEKKKELIPESLFRFPSLRFGGLQLPSLLEEDFATHPSNNENLTVSEDENNFYIEAALPGLKESEIEATVDDDTLWIRGKKEEEESDKKKKFYRKASRSFSYSVALPSTIEESAEPEAEFKDGLMKITFPKKAQTKSRQIKFKRS